ncbi:MAG TPA: hypothetical protein VI072_06865 [Polyangiaceae bacterium]
MSERLLDVLDYWDILRHVSVALLATGAGALLDWLGVQHLALTRLRRAVKVALMLLALAILVGVTLTLATMSGLNPTWVYRVGICIAWASAALTFAASERRGWVRLSRERQPTATEREPRPARAQRLRLLYAVLPLAAGTFTWDRVLCGPLLYAVACSDRALVESVAWGFNYDAPAMEPKNDYSGFSAENMLLQSSRRDDATRDVIRTLQRTPAPSSRNSSARIKLLFRHLSEYPNDEAVRELGRWATLPEASEDVRTAAAKALTIARERRQLTQPKR